MPEYVIWPAYIDSSKTRSEGRRLPRDVAVDSPSAAEVANAAKQVGYEPEYEPDKQYPRSWWEGTGRVTVETEDSKPDVLRAVAAYVDVLREEA
ncbi:MAG: signal recognition particle subunit SRP19 [Methanobacteriota archaeon]|jgi:signal recognition particle subunit SRP19|uniref:Signal recognition particle 19 kDa protein n=1 Tax=Halorutilus salinus TaxID=2487751 RepID=A0A9Q4C5H3_9EURY|nr:signal recognition particle subunit SRP19/SEC65 family protein [Halorutilus salinus]MCX2819475.1 signal recognition particle protein Srp19 [Halorutilus salinus]